jgi:hypothetical protein
MVEVLTTIYPPPGGRKGQVRSCGFSTHAQTFVVLLNSGALCLYKLKETGASELTTVIELKDIRDALQRKLKQHGLNFRCILISDIQALEMDYESADNALVHKLELAMALTLEEERKE